MASQLLLRATKLGLELAVPAGCSRVVGRRADRADIVIPDLTVASRHARFFEREGLWHVEDLGSHCGVYVNDTLARGEQPLKDGDIIRLGTVELHACTSRQ
jgi:pSer/pThr/pTyr-binding forkhead associated (FHA) protein